MNNEDTPFATCDDCESDLDCRLDCECYRKNMGEREYIKWATAPSDDAYNDPRNGQAADLNRRYT